MRTLLSLLGKGMVRKTVWYWILIGLVLVQVAYAGFWAAHDISARLGLWPEPAEAQAFIASLTLTQEILFFSHVILNVVVLALVWRHSRLALPVYVLSFILDRGDWVIMGGNTLFASMVDVDVWALFSFSLQGAIFALLITLSMDGTLTARRRR